MRLSFRIGSIPVRVHPLFLLLGVLLGQGLGQGVLGILVAEVVVFVSVLWHELGHALTGRAFGMQPEIDLHGFGGLTSWTARGPIPLTTWRRIAISLAGPFAGFGLAALAFGLLVVVRPPEGSLASLGIGFLLVVNLYWGIFNLLPMLPLDGGNVMLAALNGLTKGRGTVPARAVSLVIALALFAYFVLGQRWWGAMLTGLWAFENGRALMAQRAAAQDDTLQTDLERAHAALRAGDGARAVAIAGPLLAQARGDAMRAELVHMLAVGHLLQDQIEAADAVIAYLPPGTSLHPEVLAMRAEAVERRRTREDFF